MEHSIKLIDFETIDQMVQVHGTRAGFRDGHTFPNM